MAATLPAAPDRPSPDRPAASARGAGASRRVVDAARSLACLVAGLYLVTGYPIARELVAALFVGWAALAAWRFSFAWPALVALVPVVGFAAWTGWITFEETDLLILATAAGGYAARLRSHGESEADRGDAPRLSIIALVLIGLFLASTGVSFERAIAAGGGWRFDFFGGYNDPQNGLRIFKSFVFACLLAPLTLAELRRPGGFDRLGLGFTVALGFCGLAVLQERYAFTGLLEFSDDYRVTAPFWEMHVGGAALDGFLALTIPFGVREALRPGGPVRFGVALGVLALAAYACLVTFSRGVYAAVPILLVVLGLLLLRQRVRASRRMAWGTAVKAALFTIAIAVAAFFVFRTGGYRALLACLALLAVTIPAESALRRLPVPLALAALLLAVVAGASGWAVAGLLPKGTYLVFAATFAVACYAIWRDEEAPSPRRAIALVAGWLWLAADAILVAANWGGPIARADTFVVVSLIVLVTLAGSRARRSPWPAGRRERLATVAYAALVLGAVAVFTAGAYMGDRFSQTRSDLDLRRSHWTGGIARLRGADWIFGKGLGRFPPSSIHESFDGTSPGTMQLVDRPGERYLAMTSTAMEYLNFEELYRLTQRVEVRPHTRYLAIVKARAATDGTLQLDLCERQLLYHAGCQAEARDVRGGVGWQDVVYAFDSGDIGARHGLATRPVYFSIASYRSGQTVDVRSVHVIGPDGRDLLTNGDFANRTAFWFTTSNRFHLPWHIKNIVLDVLFDQGVFGLASFVLVVGGAWLRTAVGRACRHPDAPYVAAALVGYVGVGATDSLLDVPRVAFLFYMIVIIGLALRNPRPAPADRIPSPAAPADDAAARAARRGRAFGSRRAPDAG